MSRQNKVNPGMYTQRGRLTQDDAAREIAKQRNVGSPHTWQPVQRDQQPPMIEEPDQDETGDDQENDQEMDTPAAVEKEPARAKAARPATAKAAKTAKRSAQSTSRRPAKTAARSKKEAPRKSAPRKSGLANKATTATKRGKAKKAGPARATKGQAQSAKRKKTNRGLRLRSGQPRAKSRGGKS